MNLSSFDPTISATTSFEPPKSRRCHCLFSNLDRDKMDDRISELPDEILSYILTMLSMKDLFYTSILSRRWCKLWGLRRDLYFDIHNVLGNKDELIEKGFLIDVNSKYVDPNLSRDEFVKRVDQFVKNFPGTKIDSFLVSFNLYFEQSNNIDQWISFAISRGVERIDLLFLGRPFVLQSQSGERYKFAFKLFSETNASTLKHIGLEYCHLVHPTNCDFERFKHLKSLSLLSVKVDEIFIESLLSKCQLLEELSLVDCEFKSSTPKIINPSLCHLNVSKCYKVSGSNNNDITLIELMLVDCLKLTSLECDVDDLSTLNINTPVLKRINFSISFEEYLDEFALLATFPELEIMHLGIVFPMVTPFQTIAQPLKYLKQLDCIIFLPFIMGEECDLMLILDILRASPLLQKLSIMIIDPVLFENQKDIRDVEVFSHNEVKVIELGGCVGNWYEIEFVTNVLKYAQKLEQIVLSPYWREDDSSDWNSNSVWFQSGREKISEKIQAEEIVRQEKLVLL